MRGHNLRAAAFRRMNGNSIFGRVKRFLTLHGLPQFVIGFREGNGSNPSHKLDLVFPASRGGIELRRALKLRVPRPIANSRKMLAIKGDHGWLLIALTRIAIKAVNKVF